MHDSKVYDPQADSWQQVASMPQATCRHAAAAMGGKIFVSGGLIHDRCHTSTVVAFDPCANTWTQLASMFKARGGHASAVIQQSRYRTTSQIAVCLWRDQLWKDIQRSDWFG